MKKLFWFLVFILAIGAGGAYYYTSEILPEQQETALRAALSGLYVDENGGKISADFESLEVGLFATSTKINTISISNLDGTEMATVDEILIENSYPTLGQNIVDFVKGNQIERYDSVTASGIAMPVPEMGEAASVDEIRIEGVLIENTSGALMPIYDPETRMDFAAVAENVHFEGVEITKMRFGELLSIDLQSVQGIEENRIGEILIENLTVDVPGQVNLSLAKYHVRDLNLGIFRYYAGIFEWVEKGGTGQPPMPAIADMLSFASEVSLEDFSLKIPFTANVSFERIAYEEVERTFFEEIGAEVATKTTGAIQGLTIDLREYLVSRPDLAPTFQHFDAGVLKIDSEMKSDWDPRSGDMAGDFSLSVADQGRLYEAMAMSGYTLELLKEMYNPAPVQESVDPYPTPETATPEDLLAMVMGAMSDPSKWIKRYNEAMVDSEMMKAFEELRFMSFELAYEDMSFMPKAFSFAAAAQGLTPEEFSQGMQATVSMATDGMGSSERFRTSVTEVQEFLADPQSISIRFEPEGGLRIAEFESFPADDIDAAIELLGLEVRANEPVQNPSQ